MEIDELITVSIFLVFASIIFSWRRWYEITIINNDLKKSNEHLQKAFQEIRRLNGILPICSSCKKIRDDEGYWHQVESYLRDHSEADFSHSICPDCAKKLYPGLLDREK